MPKKSAQWKQYRQMVLEKLGDVSSLFEGLAQQSSSTDGWVTALCPFHEDHDPSFAFRSDTGQWCCFAGCGKGSVFDYLMLTSGKSFKDTLLDVGDRVGVPRPQVDRPTHPPIPEDLIQQWVKNLWADDTALRYLRDKRGLSDATLKKYEIGWDPRRQRHTIPVRDKQGNVVNVRLYHADEKPKILNYTKGRHKYGSPARLYGLDELVGYAGKQVILCEGEWDRLLLQQEGFMAVSGTHGASTFRSEWIPYFKDKDAVVLYDCDPEGQRAATTVVLKSLKKSGARSVKNVVLPLKGTKDDKDVTDYFHTRGLPATDLQKLIDEAQTPEDSTPSDRYPYFIEDDCIGYMKRIGRGDDATEIFVPLANFTARVIEERALDDGEETRRHFIIQVRLKSGRHLQVEVPATQFASMSWVVREAGVRARISAGQGAHDRLREAIQVFSADVEEHRAYIHTGWRQVDGQWIYLHSGRTDVHVELEPPLNRYALPERPEDVTGALRRSLALLDVGPDEVTVPLLAAVFLAPLCQFLHPDFALFLVGKTGSLKSTLAALFLGHYGDFPDKTVLPASWESTDNALEQRLFILKDTLCIIDDFAPCADAYAQRKQAQRAQRIIRSMGNRSGRARLHADLTARRTYIPRGLMISTGEDLPPGQSILARTLSIEVDRKQLDLEAVTRSQEETSRLPHGMAGYIEWLAPQLDALPLELSKTWREHRDRFSQQAAHLRIPEILAYLALGIDLFAACAQELDAITPQDAQALAQRAHRALLALGDKHGRRVREEDPATVFIGTIASMLTQRIVRLAPRDGSGEPIGMIGWQDSEYAYLIPVAARQAVARYLREGGGHFPHSPRALNEALDQRDVLVKGSDGKATRLVKIRGRNHRVLQIPLDRLEPETDDLEEVTPR